MPDMIWEARHLGRAGTYVTYEVSVNGRMSAMFTLLPEEWRDLAAKLGLVEGQDGVWIETKTGEADD